MPMLSRAYRLDAESAHFFGAVLLHLATREDKVIGRFGRSGYVRATESSGIIRGSWHRESNTGWITLHFDPQFRSFEGSYGTSTLAVALGYCHGTMVP